LTLFIAQWFCAPSERFNGRRKPTKDVVLFGHHETQDRVALPKYVQFVDSCFSNGVEVPRCSELENRYPFLGGEFRLAWWVLSVFVCLNIGTLSERTTMTH
jgi:hypothetical protein